MNATSHTLAGIEQTLSTVEESVSLPAAKTVGITHVTVDWICPNPSDILPLLASLSPEKVKVFSKSALHQNARGIPLTLRHSDKTKLDIHFRKLKGTRGYKAFKALGTDNSIIEKAALSGQLKVGTGEKPPLDVSDIKTLLRFLQDVHIDDPDDLSSLVESITFDAPLDILDGFEVTINPSREKSTADVVWFVFPAGVGMNRC